jgi:hypothetical protein
MKNINIKNLGKYNISIEELLYLYMLEQNRFEEALFIYEMSKSNNKINPINLESLEQKGYVKIKSHTLKGILLKAKSIDMLNEKVIITNEEKKWLTFFLTYPYKVPNSSNGFRVLRTQDANTHLAKALKIKYNKIIKSDKYIYEYIMNGLNNHIKSMNGNLMYMPAMESWLNGRQWELYNDFSENGEKKDICIYGSDEL